MKFLKTLANSASTVTEVSAKGVVNVAATLANTAAFLNAEVIHMAAEEHADTFAGVDEHGIIKYDFSKFNKDKENTTTTTTTTTNTTEANGNVG